MSQDQFLNAIAQANGTDDQGIQSLFQSGWEPSFHDDTHQHNQNNQQNQQQPEPIHIPFQQQQHVSHSEVAVPAHSIQINNNDHEAMARTFVNGMNMMTSTFKEGFAVISVALQVSMKMMQDINTEATRLRQQQVAAEANELKGAASAMDKVLVHSKEAIAVSRFAHVLQTDAPQTSPVPSPTDSSQQTCLPSTAAPVTSVKTPAKSVAPQTPRPVTAPQTKAALTARATPQPPQAAPRSVTQTPVKPPNAPTSAVKPRILQRPSSLAKPPPPQTHVDPSFVTPPRTSVLGKRVSSPNPCATPTDQPSRSQPVSSNGVVANASSLVSNDDGFDFANIQPFPDLASPIASRQSSPMFNPANPTESPQRFTDLQL